MSNAYFQFTGVLDLVPNTLAKAEEVNAPLQAIEAGFDKLPDPAEAPLKGFAGPTAVGEAVLDVHAARKAYVDALREYVDEQVAQLRIESADLLAALRVVIQEELAGLEDSIDLVDAKASDLLLELAGLRFDANELLLRTSEVNTRVTFIQDSIPITLNAINNVSILVGTLDVKITTLVGAVEAIQTDITNQGLKLIEIETDVADVATDIEDVGDRVDSAKGVAEEVRDNQALLATEVDEARTTLNEIKTDTTDILIALGEEGCCTETLEKLDEANLKLDEIKDFLGVDNPPEDPPDDPPVA